MTVVVPILCAVIITFMAIALFAAWDRWRDAVYDRDLYKRWWQESRRELDELRAAIASDAEKRLAAWECVEDIRAIIAAYDGEDGHDE